MDRRNNRQVLFAVFQSAVQDRKSLIYSYGDDTEMVEELEKDIKAFRRLQKRIFGTTVSKLDAEIGKMTKVTWSEVIEIIKQEYPDTEE